jgi:hypothetical protein
MKASTVNAPIATVARVALIDSLINFRFSRLWGDRYFNRDILT